MKINMIERPEFAIGETVFAAEFYDGASDGSDEDRKIIQGLIQEVQALEFRMKQLGK